MKPDQAPDIEPLGGNVDLNKRQGANSSDDNQERDVKHDQVTETERLGDGIDLNKHMDGNSDGDNQDLDMKTESKTDALGGDADPTEHEDCKSDGDNWYAEDAIVQEDALVREDAQAQEQLTEDKAIYVPSDSRKDVMSNIFSCYMSLDGNPIGSPLDATTASQLKSPESGLAFTVQFLWHPFQYSLMEVKVTAPGIAELKNEAVATIVVKGVSMRSFERESLTGDSLVQHLKPFGGTSEMPDKITKLTAICTTISMSIHDDVRRLLDEADDTRWVVTELDRIRAMCHATEDKKVEAIFHASALELDYVELTCDMMQYSVAADRDKDHELNPLKPFFEKSPNAMLYHYGNAIQPGQPGFETEKFMTLGTYDCYDTPQEQLLTIVQGKLCSWWGEAGNAIAANGAPFQAHAVELRHYRGRLFHLSVKAPEDGAYLPGEGDLCYIRLRGITREMPKIAPAAWTAAELEPIATNLHAASDEASDYPQPLEHIRDCCEPFVKPEALTDDIIVQLQRGDEEGAFALLKRVKALVRTWAEDGLLIDTRQAAPSGDAEPAVDKREWWRAQRIATTLPGAPSGRVSFLVTLPLVPKNEAPSDGPRPAIDVKFPILDWDAVTNAAQDNPSAERGCVEQCVEQHLADEKMELTVYFRMTLSDKCMKRAVAAANELSHPAAADKEFPVSEQSLSIFRYLRNFRCEETGNVFDKFPHMGNILHNVDKVPEPLQRRWREMDSAKQEAYRAMENLTENIHWIAGVAGTGKSNFLQFVILMAMFGDKDKEHPVKVIDFVPQNDAVSDFADDMIVAFEELGRQDAVVRLHPFDSEIGDWMSTRVRKEERTDLFDKEDADRACIALGDQFVIQHQLAQMSISVNDARAQNTKSRRPFLGVQQQAYKFFEAHKDDFPKLRDALDDLAKSNGPGEEAVNLMSDIKALVIELYAAFLRQFTGVVVATPYAGCLAKFVRDFEADIVMVDEACRMDEADFLMIIRHHDPGFFVVVGDPRQPGPFVHDSHGDIVTNPFKEIMKRSPLERALSYGGVVKARLVHNHRGKGSLPGLASRLLYHRTMRYANGEDAWPSETLAWHEWLKGHCPMLVKTSQRILIELQGAAVGKLGTSSFNMAHVQHVCTLVVEAITDDNLRGLNGKTKSILVATFYKAQQAKYMEALDAMVSVGTLTREQRRLVDVRTVDGAQGFAADLVVVDFVKSFTPGFTCDRRRLCVAVTRARQAEIIVMSRGMFVGRRPSPEDPAGHDVSLLAKLYAQVAGFGGIVTKGAAPEHTAAPDVDVDPDTQCRNCGKPGHRHKECTEPLSCKNCLESGHGAAECPKPHIERCSNCNGTDHSRKDCLSCTLCHGTGHKRDNCPKAGSIKCYNCDQAGHQAKDCTNPPALKCTNCRQPGHSAMGCNFCTKCKVEGHTTKACQAHRTCQTCGVKGHTKFFCPQQKCERCSEIGHNDFNCPKRLMADGVTTLIPLNVPRIGQNRVEMLEDRIGIATRQADDQKQAERKRLHEERRKKLAAMNAKVPDHRRTKDRTRTSDNVGPLINEGGETIDDTWGNDANTGDAADNTWGDDANTGETTDNTWGDDANTGDGEGW